MISSLIEWPHRSTCHHPSRHNRGEATGTWIPRQIEDIPSIISIQSASNSLIALRVSEAVRPETAENRLGQRRLLLAPPQLYLQLHDRNRRSVGVSLALGGAWCSPVAAEDRFRPQRHVLVSRHRAAGAKQSGGNHRPRLGTVARASGGGRASRRLGRPEGLHPDNRWRRLHFGRRADGRGR